MDDLSIAYEKQPVVFLEDYYSPSSGNRVSRFWAVFPGGTAYFPFIIVDSGNQWSYGYVSFSSVYGGMVDAAMDRPPGAGLKVTRTRLGDVLSFQVEVTNLSGVTLSTANNSAVHAIVFEVEPTGVARVTDRYVRRVADTAVDPALANGATATFLLDVDLTGLPVNWSNIHAVVLVDYQPNGPTEAYDMLQAYFSP